MEFKEVYCINCKKVLGRYNIKFYNDDKIGELLKTTTCYSYTEMDIKVSN